MGSGIDPNSVTIDLTDICWVDGTSRFIHTDGIAGRFGDFPELTKAVRAGDLETLRFLCEQLFRLNSHTNKRPGPSSVAA